MVGSALNAVRAEVTTVRKHHVDEPEMSQNGEGFDVETQPSISIVRDW